MSPALKALLATIALLSCQTVLAGEPEADGSQSPAADHQVLVMVRLPLPHFRPDTSYTSSYDDRLSRSAGQRVARQLAQKFGLTVVDDWPMPALGVDCYVLEVPEDQPLASVVDRLAQDSRTQWVQPLQQFRGLSDGASLYSVQPGAKLWHLQELHRTATGRGVRVAVIDSGVDVEHPDLVGQIASARNFVDAGAMPGEAHGTEVAGIIAARADGQARIVGVAPGARLLALRACWTAPRGETLCNSFTLAKALEFAIEQRADVINLSLSGPSDTLLERLIRVALKADITVVSAVDPAAPAGGFPASLAGVIAVSNSFSPNSESGVLVAPGQDIPASAPGTRWDFVSGSSFAAAHVSGLAALLRQVEPPGGRIDRSTWVFFPLDGETGLTGTVDACATVSRAVASCSCHC